MRVLYAHQASNPGGFVNHVLTRKRSCSDGCICVLCRRHPKPERISRSNLLDVFTRQGCLMFKIVNEGYHCQIEISKLHQDYVILELFLRQVRSEFLPVYHTWLTSTDGFGDTVPEVVEVCKSCGYPAAYYYGPKTLCKDCLEDLDYEE